MFNFNRNQRSSSRGKGGCMQSVWSFGAFAALVSFTFSMLAVVYLMRDAIESNDEMILRACLASPLFALAGLLCLGLMAKQASKYFADGYHAANQQALPMANHAETIDAVARLVLQQRTAESELLNRQQALIPQITAEKLPAPQVPDAVDLAYVPLPTTTDKALLGLAAQGAVISDWTAVKHIAIIGPTGGGKSVLTKFLLAQAVRGGQDVHLLDPHFTRFDAETGEDWSPLTDLFRLPPETEPAKILIRLKWVVEEMDKRLALRKAGKKYLPVIIRIALDEVPAIVESEEECVALIARILREGRKVGVLLQVSSQDMLAKTLGFKNGAAVRKNFSTAFIMRDCDLTSYKLFVRDREFRSDLLEVGTACLVTESVRNHVLVRVPFASNRAILGLTQYRTSTVPASPVPSTSPIPAQKQASTNQYQPDTSPVPVKEELSVDEKIEDLRRKGKDEVAITLYLAKYHPELSANAIQRKVKLGRNSAIALVGAVRNGDEDKVIELVKAIRSKPKARKNGHNQNGHKNGR